ncbi:hypothetical protein D7027_23800 [Ochrobactrum intermedium]|nr:hypothetical protein [Brucella intermedia]PJT37172.1 hypothetical protein CN883_18575 [Ochrobactrum sp. 27A/999/2015]
MFGNEKRFIVPVGRRASIPNSVFLTKVKTMSILVQLRDSVNVIREFVAPSYRPERHYMRGPGPACAARTHH